MKCRLGKMVIPVTTAGLDLGFWRENDKGKQWERCRANDAVLKPANDREVQVTLLQVGGAKSIEF